MSTEPSFSRTLANFTKGSVFHRFPPSYIYDDEDSYDANFYNFDWDTFTLICTHQFCLSIHSFNFPLIHYLNENDIKNHHRCLFSSRRPKCFDAKVKNIWGNEKIVATEFRNILLFKFELFIFRQRRQSH